LQPAPAAIINPETTKNKERFIELRITDEK